MSDKLRNYATILLSAVFIFGLAFWCLVKPADTVSYSERKELEPFPEFSADALLDTSFMKDFETYTTQQFPLRDQFRTVKAFLALYGLQQEDVNGIYICDGYASAMDYPLDNASISHAAERFQYVYDQYLKDTNSKVYLSIVPDKNYFMAEPSGHPMMDYAALVENLRAQCPDMTYIDIFDTLALEDYYRTDTHWRQEKLIDTAQAVAQAMGTSISGEYEVNRLEQPFYGVYYGQSALPLPADELYYLTNDTLDQCTVFYHEFNKTGGLYELSYAEGYDPYEIFLSGTRSLLKITNPNAETDKRLIVFRDSFGSSLLPLLAEGYSEILAIDIRALPPQQLRNPMLDNGQPIDFDNCDVLFLYSTLVLNNSETIK